MRRKLRTGGIRLRKLHSKMSVLTAGLSNAAIRADKRPLLLVTVVELRGEKARLEVREGDEPEVG